MNNCLWKATPLPYDCDPLAQLDGTKTDVAIIGGGYTGLWTAYWLKKLAPDLAITVLEAYTLGHGASGRNGGWLMGSLEGLTHFVTSSGRLSQAVLSELRSLVTSAVGTLTELEIDCDLKHGGGLFAASRYTAQQPRAQAMLQALWALGFSSDDYQWLSASDLRSRFTISQPFGAIETPHVATLHPGKLLRGLASEVQKLGVNIREQCAALSFKKHSVQTSRGLIACKHIVIATEGYSEKTPMNRRLISVRSGMVSTAPMSQQQWQQLGFSRHEAFCDLSRASTYCQRTADNRLIVGARGNYAWGNKPWHAHGASAKGTRQRITLAKALFPTLKDVEFTHAWEGSLGISRRLTPHVVFDHKACIATAGGYAGEGVGASFLFGRTLAEGITGCASNRLHMPWVMRGNIDNIIPRWEFEPLPWLGFTTMTTAIALEDAMLSHELPGTWLVTKACDALETMMGIG